MSIASRKFKKILLILAIFFAIIYSVLAGTAGTIFNSPDENANYFFSRLFADENSLVYPIATDSDVIHPRSMLVVNQKIVPQSFLGIMLIYGILAKIFTTKAILFFTPIIAAVSVLFFYEIFKNIFGTKVAFLSCLLVFIHPSFWYYSTHSMYHNILFVSLLIIGLYFLIKNECGMTRNDAEINSQKLLKVKCQMLNVALASLFIGLALIVRSSEIIWVLASLIVLGVLNRDKINFKKIILGLIVLFIVALPILFFNNKLYGSPFLTGYNLNETVTGTSIFSWLSKWLYQTNSIKTSSAVVGARHLNAITRNFWNYGIYLFWWFSIPTLLGLIWFIKNYKKFDKKQKNYLIIFLIASIYLIGFYGGWTFHDNPDPSKITIGASYVRYWLPIYIFSTPFLVLILLKLKKILNKKLLIVGMAFLVGFNFLFVFKLAEENIADNISSDYGNIKEKVLNLTEKNAVIVAGYYDKLFFPQRLVIENLEEEREKRLREINKLLDKNYPIYYYSWNSEQDIKYLNDKVLGEYGLVLVEGVKIGEGERLFKIVSKLQAGKF